ERGNDGITAVKTPPPSDEEEPDAPPPSDSVRQESGNLLDASGNGVAEVKGEVEVEVEVKGEGEEGASAPPARKSKGKVVSSPDEPAEKTLRHTSRHLDPRRFVNGYIPSGTGINAVE